VNEPRIAIVTPSFARDFTLCAELNASVLAFLPAETKHYIVVDGRDMALFRQLENSRTVVAAVEDVLPKGYFKLPRSKKWWFSTPAMLPAKGWLVQQLVKLSMPRRLGEDVLVNVDSDVRFIRPVALQLFARDGKTRLYRQPAGVVAGMPHVKWHKSVCRLLNVAPDVLPMDDYVGNMISWNSGLVAGVLARIESVSGAPWHVAFTRARQVSEYLTYGTYIEKILGTQKADVWVDERSWCHTYWGPGPLSASDYVAFVEAMPADDVAFSIAGYTDTDPEVLRRATALAVARAT
jgi:hypothetical protein